MDGSQISSVPPSLPKNFPTGLPMPRFQIGDRVRWQPLPSQDFGTVVGLTYAPVPPFDTWNWQYVVWLDADSPSRGWVISETAWETDLEVLQQERS